MIKLSDYLDYLSNEVIQARKNMDLHSIANAKMYSEHEYLKYFKAPRFTMPVIKLDIPIKISDLDSETKYNFKMDKEFFLYEVNKKLSVIEKKHDIILEHFTKKDMETKSFSDTVKLFEKKDQRYIKDLNPKINIDNIKKPIIQPRLSTSVTEVTNKIVDNKLIKIEIDNAISASFKKLFKPAATKLNDIYISPDILSSKGAVDDKILLKLNVELVEENLKITKIKNDDGSIVEEIVLDQ